MVLVVATVAMVTAGGAAPGPRVIVRGVEDDWGLPVADPSAENTQVKNSVFLVSG